MRLHTIKLTSQIAQHLRQQWPRLNHPKIYAYGVFQKADVLELGCFLHLAQRTKALFHNKNIAMCIVFLTWKVR